MQWEIVHKEIVFFQDFQNIPRATILQQGSNQASIWFSVITSLRNSCVKVNTTVGVNVAGQLCLALCYFLSGLQFFQMYNDWVGLDTFKVCTHSFNVYDFQDTLIFQGHRPSWKKLTWPLTAGSCVIKEEMFPYFCSHLSASWSLGQNAYQQRAEVTNFLSKDILR